MSKYFNLAKNEEWVEKGAGGAFIHTPKMLQFKDANNEVSVGVFETVRKSPPAAFKLKGAMKPERICLHFTGGALEGDMNTLTGNRPSVSVPFLIARSGKIYNLFNPDTHWAYHLGSGCLGGNANQSPKTIGIELSNYGPLYLGADRKTLQDAYKGNYCDVTDLSAYVKLDAPYRGVSYFATFTEQQYVALKKLLVYLTVRYKIPYTFLPEAKRSDILSTLNGAPGILCHTNYRTDKLDFPPKQFDWNKIAKN